MSNTTNNQQQGTMPWGFNNGYNTGFAGGATYGAPMQQPKMVNPLSSEERDSLKQNNAFTLQVTQADLAQGICTHKDPQTGQYSTVPNPDGTVTCSICHTTFDPNKVVDVDYVQHVTDEFLNILETCKLLGVDLNADVIRGVFQMSPFVKKIPELFKMAQTSFLKYNEQNPTAYQAQNPNMWAMMGQVLSGQPMMWQQPMYQQAPMWNAQGAQYQAPPMQAPQYMQNAMVPGGSPFYAQPVQQAPMQQPMLPNQVPVQAPQTQAASADEKTGDTVNVKTQMSL